MITKIIAFSEVVLGFILLMPNFKSHFLFEGRVPMSIFFVFAGLLLYFKRRAGIILNVLGLVWIFLSWLASYFFSQLGPRGFGF